MSTVQDTDKLIIARDDDSYLITFDDFKNQGGVPGGEIITPSIITPPNGAGLNSTYTGYTPETSGVASISTSNTQEFIDPQSSGSNIMGLAYGNGRWAGMTETQKFVSSSDGINWGFTAGGFQVQERCCTYGPAGFMIAHGGQDKLFRSTDGVNWSLYYEGSTGQGYTTVRYVGGKYFAMRSSNDFQGIFTTTISSVTPFTLPSEGYGSTSSKTRIKDFGWGPVSGPNGIYLAVGAQGDHKENKMFYSTDDAVTWKDIVSDLWGSNMYDTGGFESVVWGRDRFVAVGQMENLSKRTPGNICSIISFDGIAWEAGEMMNTALGGVYFINDTFYALGEDGTLMRSVDGKQWTFDTVTISSTVGGTYQGAKRGASDGNKIIYVDRTNGKPMRRFEVGNIDPIFKKVTLLNNKVFDTATGLETANTIDEVFSAGNEVTGVLGDKVAKGLVAGIDTNTITVQPRYIDNPVYIKTNTPIVNNMVFYPGAPFTINGKDYSVINSSGYDQNFTFRGDNSKDTYGVIYLPAATNVTVGSICGFYNSNGDSYMLQDFKITTQASGGPNTDSYFHYFKNNSTEHQQLITSDIGNVNREGLASVNGVVCIAGSTSGTSKIWYFSVDDVEDNSAWQQSNFVGRSPKIFAASDLIFSYSIDQSNSSLKRLQYSANGSTWTDTSLPPTYQDFPMWDIDCAAKVGNEYWVGVKYQSAGDEVKYCLAKTTDPAGSWTLIENEYRVMSIKDTQNGYGLLVSNSKYGTLNAEGSSLIITKDGVETYKTPCPGGLRFNPSDEINDNKVFCSADSHGMCRIDLTSINDAWENGMKIVSESTVNPETPSADTIQFVGSTPTAEPEDAVGTWGLATWEISTDANFTSPMVATKQISNPNATQTYTPNGEVVIEKDTQYWARLKYASTVPEKESSLSAVSTFKTAGQPDGWFDVALPKNKTWRNITYGNGRYIMADNTSDGDAALKVCLISDDGLSWREPTAVTPQSGAYYGGWLPVYGEDGKWVITNERPENPWFSIDNGETWERSDTSGYSNFTQFNWGPCAYGNGRFLMMATGGSNDGLCVISDNGGANWRQPTSADTPGGRSSNWSVVAFGDGRFVIANLGGKMYWSTNGENWDQCVGSPDSTTSDFGGKVDALIWTGTQFVALNQSAKKVATSPDGITWTYFRVTEFWSTSDVPPGNLAYSNGTYIIAFNNNTAWSTDLVNWTNNAPSDEYFSGSTVDDDGVLWVCARGGPYRVQYSYTGKDASPTLFYDVSNKEAISGDALLNKFGIDPDSPEYVLNRLGIAQLTEQPNFEVATFVEEGNKYRPIQDAKSVQAELDASQANFADLESRLTSRLAVLEAAAFSAPIALNGYYPLYGSEADSNAAGNGSSHTHVVNGITYYMPDGGTTIYHGNYVG